jgi:hypothetical protein
MHWAEKYIGTPYEEANCAVLVARAISEEFGLHDIACSLVAFNGAGISPLARKQLFDNETLNYGHQITESAVVNGDCALLSSESQIHMGLIVKRGKDIYILHSTREAGAVCQSLNAIKAVYKISGFYRWKHGR